MDLIGCAGLGDHYKHRFLNRIQIQAFLRHKDYKTINAWLRDLREKHYVEWIYSTDFTEKTKPAVYYLGMNAIRHFKTLEYPPDELRKRYRESTRSQTYIDRCLLIADCCIALDQARDEGGETERWYFHEVESEYSKDGYFHFLIDDELIRPHLCFSKEVYDLADDPRMDEGYVLEVFDATLPRYRVRKRLKSYIEYLDSENWQTETDTDKLPIALFIYPTKADMIYCKRASKKLLEDAWNTEHIHMRFTTVELVKKHGVLGKIWEEVTLPEQDD
jgi:hypothetical protein